MLGPVDKPPGDSGPFTRPSNRILLDSPAPSKTKSSSKKKSGKNERNNNTSAGKSISRGSTEELGEPGKCCACSAVISDRYFLAAAEKQWHLTCLRCNNCSVVLGTDQKCYIRDGQVYCKDDFYRNFTAKKCSRCLMSITNEELVMRAREHVYHVQCFACASCNHVLTTGENFGMKENMIFCQVHFDPLLPDSLAGAPDFFSRSPTFSGEFPLDGGTLADSVEALFAGVEEAQKQETKSKKKKKKKPHSVDAVGADQSIQDLMDFGSEGFSFSQPRQKRTRTSFKHHQLRMLKAYFIMNHNPDAKDLKQLSQKTGLGKRVLQVWFQNARAKQRKSTSKHETSSQGGEGNNNDSSLPDVAPGSQTLDSTNGENPSDGNTSNSFGEFTEDLSQSPGSQPNDVHSSSGSALDLPDLPVMQVAEAAVQPPADLGVLLPSDDSFHEASEPDISDLYPVTMTSLNS